MTDTQQLLADYVTTGSESAFRELVSRYVDLVHSAAVRLVNSDSHLETDGATLNGQWPQGGQSMPLEFKKVAK